MSSLESRVDDSIASAVNSVKVLEGRVLSGEKNLERNIDKVLDRRLDGVEENLEKLINRKLSALPRGGARGSSEKEDKYLLCRRSLRMWPLDEGDLHRSLHAFLIRKLKFSANDARALEPAIFQKAKVK